MNIRHRLLMFLLRALPAHGRRILIVIMMYRALIHVGFAVKKDLRVLNKYLTLATDPQSLRLALGLSKYIWTDKRINNLYFTEWWERYSSEFTLDEKAIMMVRYIPSNLHYDSNDGMVSDMRILLDINEWSNNGINRESP